MEATVDTLTAQDVLESVEQGFGFVPNLFKELARESPAAAEIYRTANDLLGELSLTPEEVQLVILAVSGYNDCHYCTKAHAKAGQMVGLSEDVTATVVEGGLPDDERFHQLVVATRRVLGKRGWLNEDDLADLEARGLSRTDLYEIIAIVGIKTISNYVNHIAHTEVDSQFQ